MRALLTFLLIASIPALALSAGFGAPSNPAGVWEMEFTPGVHLISFPVLPKDATVTDIFGDSFPGSETWDEATRIMTIEDGVVLGSFYNENGEWFGSVDTLAIHRGYWLGIPDGTEPITLRLVGGGIALHETMIDTIRPGVNIVAAPAIVPVSLAGSGLTESGFYTAEFAPLADRLYTEVDLTLAPAWRTPQYGWQGAQFTMMPGRAYVIERAGNREAFVWTRPNHQIGQTAGGTNVIDEPQVPAALAPLLGKPVINLDTPPADIQIELDRTEPVTIPRSSNRRIGR